MTTGAITAKRPVDHNFDEIRSSQSAITEKNAQNSIQNTSTGFPAQTQSSSVYLNPSENSTGTIKSISPTELNGISIPNNSALIPVVTIPLHVLTISI